MAIELRSDRSALPSIRREVPIATVLAMLVGLVGCGSDGAVAAAAAHAGPAASAVAQKGDASDSIPDGAATTTDAASSKSPTSSTRERVTRVTRADGAVVVTYRDLGAAPADTLVPDLRLGRANGPAAESFGRVRDIEVGPDGAIYVLDYSVPAVRIFSADGRYVSSLGRRGQGPGEFQAPMGIALASDGTLWVQEGRQGASAVLVFGKDGREIVRHSTFPRGALTEAGGVDSWDAFFGADGRIWQTATRYQGTLPGSSVMGVIDTRVGSFAQSFDPRTRALDSILLNEDPLRRYRYQHPSDRGGMATTFGIVPFDPIRLVALDRAANAWTALSTGYRIERKKGSSTTLVVEAMAEPVAPTANEREYWESLVSVGGLDLEVPQKSHVLQRIFTDDENRLWVQPKARPGEINRFDVFSQDGEHLASVAIPGTIVMTPVVRGGSLYTTILGELNIHVVIRAPLPVSLR